MIDLPLIVVPDEDDPDGASLYVEGRLGSRPYRFLLDTGAGRTFLVYDEHSAGFERVDGGGSSGVFAKSTHDVIRVPRLEIGEMVRENVMISRGSPDEGRTVSLIGMDVLKDASYHFLFDQNRVLVDAEYSISTEPLWVDKVYHPYVDVGLGAHQASAVWDTGASMTVVDLRLVEAHPTYFEAVGHSVGTDSTGQQMETPMYLIRGAVIGGRQFAPHRAAGVDLSHVNTGLERPMDFILGYTTLSQANWLFDFPRLRWAITEKADHDHTN